MDRTTTQVENEHLTMSSTDHLVEKIELLPVEVWVKIFEFAGRQKEDWQWRERNKDLAKLRNVCKKWTNIIDENIFFYVMFNDRILKERRTNHLRLNRCSFYDLTVDLPSNPIRFREPTLLTDVAIHGTITIANFCWLISQLPNWNCLRLGEKFFECDEIFSPSNIANENSMLSNFWNRLEQLHLECTHANFCDKLKANALSNLEKLLSTNMTGLKNFHFVVRWNVEMFRLTINFLLQNPNVKNSNISCIQRDVSIGSPKIYNADLEDLKRIQLNALSLQIFNLTSNECAAFLPLIKVQKSLIKLEIKDTCAFHTLSNSLCFGDTLGEVIKNNYGSLTCLNLFVRYPAGLVDAKMFQKMPFLQTLILKAEDGPPNSQIQNLVCLPSSIEILDLECFNHDVQDLLDMCMGDNLVNLRRFKLYPCTGETQITPDALDCLMLKKKLRKLELGSIVLDIFDYQMKQNFAEDEDDEENKAFLFTKKGFVVPVEEVWFKNGYGIGDIRIDCKDLLQEAKYLCGG